MPIYRERRATIEARDVTPETLDDLATWCGGIPDPQGGDDGKGSVLYRAGGARQEAPTGAKLIRRTDNTFTHEVDPDRFQTMWELDDQATT